MLPHWWHFLVYYHGRVIARPTIPTTSMALRQNWCQILPFLAHRPENYRAYQDQMEGKGTPSKQGEESTGKEHM